MGLRGQNLSWAKQPGTGWRGRRAGLPSGDQFGGASPQWDDGAEDGDAVGVGARPVTFLHLADQQRNGDQPTRFERMAVPVQELQPGNRHDLSHLGGGRRLGDEAKAYESGDSEFAAYQE